MFIIIEGCDGAGKSSLVGELQRAIAAEGLGDCRVEHFGPPTSWPVSEYELPLHGYVPGNEPHLICDRFHLGERVYGPLYRGKSELEGGNGAHVRAALARRGAFIIYLLPSRGQLQAAIAERGDDYIDHGDISKIAAHYVQLAEAETLPHMTLRRYWRASDINSMIIRARIAEAGVRHLAEFKSLIGEPYPEMLFVGERRSMLAGDHVEAFVPLPGSPNALLMEAVALRGWVSWAAINAAEDDVALAVHRLVPRRVIALGNFAARACASAAIPYASVVPPAHASRLMNLTADQYATMIEVTR